MFKFSVLRLRAHTGDQMLLFRRNKYLSPQFWQITACSDGSSSFSRLCPLIFIDPSSWIWMDCRRGFQICPLKTHGQYSTFSLAASQKLELSGAFVSSIRVPHCCFKILNANRSKCILSCYTDHLPNESYHYVKLVIGKFRFGSNNHSEFRTFWRSVIPLCWMSSLGDA